MPQQPNTFTRDVTTTQRLHYLLHLPQGYADEPGQRWPLLLFLHGMGQRGDDLEEVKVHGIAKIVDAQPDFPFIAVSPQCPHESWWTHHVATLDSLLDDVIATHRVDPQRIYLTGLSMGAFGGWHLLTETPERFAAALLVCGGHTWYLDLEKRARRVAHVPIWLFHGDADSVVPVGLSKQLEQALRAAGGQVRLTIYPGVEHDSWTQTYANPEIYDWLLRHRQGSPGEMT